MAVEKRRTPEPVGLEWQRRQRGAAWCPSLLCPPRESASLAHPSRLISHPVRGFAPGGSCLRGVFGGVCGGDPSLGRRLDVSGFLFLTVTSYRGDICFLRARLLKTLENSGDKSSFSEAYT